MVDSHPLPKNRAVCEIITNNMAVLDIPCIMQHNMAVEMCRWHTA
jgi:hypothetical protein